ncbi:MAG: SMC family ATPase [Candidatus Bathyarchaeota archaeon]|nr:SMC family ATPase [Candidatus Bathyarchaeota archaeon]
MIERVILKDFKSHEVSDVAFNSGLNIFLGEVGAGKTSIFEAVSFALFGRYAGSTNQGGLIRRGAEKAEVSLTFTTTTGRYRIDRTIYPEKTQQAKMWLFDNGEWQLAVEGATAVSKSVEDFLSVDTSTFLAAIYASQGEIKEMLETQPGRRRERLDKLLGIDMYENIWTNLGHARTIVLTELTQAQDGASGVEVLERQLEDLKVKIKVSTQELKELRKSLTRIDETFKPTEHLLKEYDDRRQRLATVRTQVEGKFTEIAKSIQTVNALRERREKAEEAKRVFDRNREFVEHEKRLEVEKRRVETVLQKKRSLMLLLRRDDTSLKQALERQERLMTQLHELKILEGEIETLDGERATLPTLRTEQASFDERLDGLKGLLVRAFSEIESQRRQVERVTELGECPTCLQTVPEAHKERIKQETSDVITKLTSNYTSLEEARDQVQEQLEAVKEKVEKAEKADRRYVETATKVKMLLSRREEIEEVEARIEEVKISVAETQRQINAIKESEETLTKIIKQLEEVAPKADRAREAEKLSAAKRDLEAMLVEEERNSDTLKGQLRKLEASEKELNETYNEKEHQDLENQVRTLRESRAKATEGITRLNKTLKGDTQQVENVKKILKEKRKAKVKVEELKVENYVIDTLRKSLRAVVQPVMRKNSVRRVSDAFQSFYQELSNDSIDYAAIDEDGNIDITRNGEPSPVNTLSGGETTCAALALRLAVCSSLTRNQLLLLDEPTIHLDEVYRAKLREFLGSHVFEQLIVVTHDNTFDTLPAKIFRVEKQRGRSVISPLQMGGA